MIDIATSFEDRVYDFYKHQDPECKDIMLFGKLFDEEVNELYEAIAIHGENPNEETRAAMVKEFADAQYTLSLLALGCRVNMQEAFRRVHESNMTKVSNGVTRREDGKIMKGPYYVAPDMQGL